MFDFADWAVNDDLANIVEGDYPTNIVELCDCCAIMVANGDESSCRDYYNHNHPTMQGNYILTGDTNTLRYGFKCHGCGESPLSYATAHDAEIV